MFEYRAREEYKTRREPCRANKQLQGRAWLCANGWPLGQRMAELTRDGWDMVPATGAGTRALDQGCSATPAGLGPLRVTSPDRLHGRTVWGISRQRWTWNATLIAWASLWYYWQFPQVCGYSFSFYHYTRILQIINRNVDCTGSTRTTLQVEKVCWIDSTGNISHW